MKAKQDVALDVVMNVKQDVVPDRSALGSSNVGNIVANPGFSGGRGHGRGSNHGGSVGSRSRGNIDNDKLYYTRCGRYHHTRETRWDLNSIPRNVFATPAKVEHPSDTTKQETN